MAAAFDSKGFAAVDKFFDGQDRETDSASFDRSKDALSRGQRRGGIGAASKKSAISSKFETVLKVGNKKRSRRDQEDDPGIQEDDHDDDDDELDVGRTAIAKDIPKQKRTTSVLAEISSSKISKQKKKGKKERQRTSQIEEKEGSEKVLSDKPLSNDDNEKSSGANNEPSADASANNTNKRKRRKVRSRQKNIRKDTRSMADKPAHLIPGNPNYQGRPMTQATRERLKQPVTTGKNIIGSHQTSVEKKGKASLATKSLEDGSVKTQVDSKELFVIDRSSVDDVGEIV
jgi:hypothetical protein